MKIGIVGLPNVGKSTLFQALTQQQVDTSNYPFATIDPNIGIVTIPDERLNKLALLSKSKKVIPAIVEFVDIAGLVKGASSGEGLGNKFLTHIREVDAICHIVRAFEKESITHVSGKPNPKSDIETINMELALKDLETITKAKDKIAKEAKAGKQEAIEMLNNLEYLERTLATLSKASAEEKILNPKAHEAATQYQLLSFKPQMVVFNISGQNNLSNLPNIPHSMTLDIGQENDIASMAEEEKKELGVESHLTQLTKNAYGLLDLMTFFTTGEDETRSWTIPNHSTAKRAGRAIHSDFEEKFIRANVIFWEKLLETRSLARARELGLIRSEGKEYIVQNGDVIEFKI
jgi:ribosome-binding ATPase